MSCLNSYRRERLQESHILALANVLGKLLYNLHGLPLPPMSSCANGRQQLVETNDNIAITQRIHQVPKEWTLFITMMRRQREHARSQLQEW